MAVPAAIIPHRVVIMPPLMLVQLTSSGRLEKDSISRTGSGRDGYAQVTPDQPLSHLYRPTMPAVYSLLSGLENWSEKPRFLGFLKKILKSPFSYSF